MPEAPFLEMIVLCGTAAGLVLARGRPGRLLAGRSECVRLAAAAGCALRLPWLAAVGFPALAALAVGLVGAVGVGLASSGRRRRPGWPPGCAPSVGRAGRRPPCGRPAAWPCRRLGGPVRNAAEAAAADDMAFMTEVTWKPPLREAAGPGGDRPGRPVPLGSPSPLARPRR